MDANPHRLTPAQLQFADEHNATAGMEAPTGEGVFLYREDEGWLYRWLVDPDGTVRDQAQFRRHPA